MFFVVSTGRSGSKTIAQILSQSPDCVCLHEPDPVLVKEATLYQYRLISDEMIKALLLSTRPPTIHGKIFGESNQKLSTLIPVLSAAFPGSKFIWLVRDGRDVVASTYYARKWYKAVDEVLDHPQSFPIPLKEWAWYRLRGDLTGEMSTAEWDALSRFEKNCWLWARTNGIIQHYLAQLPKENWMLVRLETLFEQLPDICQFLGVRVPSTVRNIKHNASAVAPVPWEEWPDDQKVAFENWCGEMMNRLYPQWRESDDHHRLSDNSIAHSAKPRLEKSKSWWRRIPFLDLIRR